MTEAEQIRHGYERCWMPESRQVAGREQTAPRQITGFCLNGQLLSGFLIWLAGKALRSVGDLLAGTVILYDPDEVLGLSGEGNDRHIILWAIRGD